MNKSLVRSVLKAKIDKVVIRCLRRNFENQLNNSSRGAEVALRGGCIWAPPRPDENIGDFALTLAARRSMSAMPHLSMDRIAEYDSASLEHPSILSRRERRHLLDQIRDLETFMVIGADMVDGYWGDIGSAVRWGVLSALSKNGADSRMISFSWNENPTRSAIRLIKESSENGVRCFPRDSQSLERVRSVGIDATLGADLAFLLNESTAPELLHSTPSAVLNLCWSAGNHAAQLDAFSQIALNLIAVGIKPIFVPTDTRPGASDLSLI